MDMKELVGRILEETAIDGDDADLIVKKAVEGGELDRKLANGLDWLERRFLPNLVQIDESGYARMCIDALKIVSTTAGTDFGTTRQRDLGQQWADLTRGYLGELALKQLLERRWGIFSELGHEKGELKDYLPMDIHRLKKPDEEEFRKPRIKIGVKATKWNGIWLDISNKQFHHSDVHFLVKVGTGRDHLFAYFKRISVFKDKILSEGRRISALTEDEASRMFDALPSMKPISAYVCGFASRDAGYEDLFFDGKVGRKHFTITSWRGPFRPGDLERIKEIKMMPKDGKVKFSGIDKFSRDDLYVFNSGSLLWEEKDWLGVVRNL